MRKANIKYARDHLRHLIDEVAEGQDVILTRRGNPVARLTSIEEKPRRLPSLAEFRSSIQRKGRSLSDEIIAAREAERY